ncbi:hypothetical protein FB45DRAFT_893645 [Roridomyces roridus]|uniref:Uncharacterized protein n=1 Tax=Roridomyces roridus TaxID=1738132 RepID=A0AAD7CG39_9AGAR|nr:hypothetical protein FB45DRAFT_893645 [Roridomyces roridus]
MTALKRKFAPDSDDLIDGPNNAKQLKLIPFPNYVPDEDACMSEAEPLAHHTRFPSNASSISDASSSSTESPYPTFNLYPLPFFTPDGSVNPNSHNFAHYAVQQPPSPPVGLIQPSSGFTHHGSGCTQIPKLKVACAPGLNGTRTMWAFCEQCGSISSVDSS